MVKICSHFPLVCNEEVAKSRLEDFISRSVEAGITDMPAIIKKDNNKLLLEAIFSNSPYLSSLLLRDMDFSAELLKGNIDEVIGGLFSALNNDIPAQRDTAQIMQHFRKAKARIALALAVADLRGQWPLSKITQTLSDFAQTVLSLSTAHLLFEAMNKGELGWPGEKIFDQATPALAQNSGYVILAMGKLGGEELNYSSDIDLIVLFDRDIIDYRGRKTPQDFFVRFTQKLVKIMQERTADGYVFRTDLRLRPDPGATAIALSMEGAEVYYQSMGLNWERAAMIKARPVAGDIQAGHDFLERIKAFVWRRHLDYVALEDIYAIKMLTHRHHGHGEICLSGHDVKLGPGGIREIEFYAQIHQLIAGGREVALRIPPTCAALDALQDAGKLSPQDNQVLQQAYIYLRTVEHRLQMVNDDQTHSLPTQSEEIDQFSFFMGYETTTEFEADLIGHLKRVQALFENLLKETHQEDEPQTTLAFPPGAYHPASLKEIEKAGFSDPEKIYDMIQNWFIGRYRACRTERAQNTLQGLVMDILHAFGKQADPVASFAKFDDFLSRLPSGVQLFSFIRAHPWLLDLLSEIMGMAPYLSDELARRPLLLDAVLNVDFFDASLDIQPLEDQLATGPDFQDVLDIMRRWANEQKFLTGIQILRDTVSTSNATKRLSNIADTVIEKMLDQVIREFSRRHGVIENSSLAILAMGKLGGGELTTTSDIDMVLIYDVKDKGAHSDGEKSLSVNHYYARLSQNFITALTALTGEGRLYEVDMRLRPSGTAGPIAVTFQSFEEYQRGQAWTWEHMALCRGRIVAGSPELGKKIDTCIKNILSHPKRDQDNLLFEVHKMRNRLADEFSRDDIWSLKHTRGGLVDIEFICQYLLLKHGADHPEIITQNTEDLIRRLFEAGILDTDTASELQQSHIALQNAQLLLRLCMGGASRREGRPQALMAVLAQRLGCPSADDIEGTLLAHQKFTLDLYQKIIGQPAEEMLPPAPVRPLNLE